MSVTAMIVATAPKTWSRSAVRTYRFGQGLLGRLRVGILAVTVVVSLAPFFYVISTSLKETKSLFSYPPHWIPDPVYLGNYVALFQKHPFGWWLGNTLAISAIVTVAFVRR